MKLSLILAHPNPGSFNHAIAETARQTLLRSGHTVFFHDLYAEGFDPMLPAREIPKGAPFPAEIARALRRDRLGRWHHCRASELVGPAAGYPQGVDRPRDPPRRGV